MSEKHDNARTSYHDLKMQYAGVYHSLESAAHASP